MKFNLSIRQITVIGLLSAVSLLLGSTPLGIIPVPTPAGAATIMHIPAIIGGVIEGPMVGGFIGLVFGIFSFLRASSPLVADPIVAIVPRIFIGIFAAYSYRLFENKFVGATVSAVVGTFTNTLGVLILAVIRGLLPAGAALGIVVTHGIPEAVLGILVTIPVVKILQRSGFQEER
ncbi:ECF transporter S component [Halonatronum saccharophilum]|uniref:ECF transporter S component n=1 Tax=Halonatronum saccharophilum TaxID=150060 RepID=UPI00047F6A2E|nr:ECF transporter S component [Halonatronum saccharophilum]